MPNRITTHVQTVIWSQPGGEVVGILPPKYVVTLLGTAGKWLYVESDEAKGFIHSQNVINLPDKKPSPQPAPPMMEEPAPAPVDKPKTATKPEKKKAANPKKGKTKTSKK